MRARLVRGSTGIEVLTINSPLSGSYITGSIKGLGVPEVRVSTGTLPGQHGGYSANPYWQPRLVTIDGHLIGDTVPDMQRRRREWSTAFAGLDDLELYIEYEDGNTYLIYCRLYGTPVLDYTPLDPTKAEFSIDLLADDPMIYDNTEGQSLTVTIPRAVGGGMTWPLTWPITSAAGQGSVTVDNPTTLTSWPDIVVTGSMTNPLLANETTGESLQLSPFTAPAGSELVIHMGPRFHTVTLNGGNVADKLTNPYPWWGLQPGFNSIRFSTGDSADTASAQMYWRNGYMGI